MAVRKAKRRGPQAAAPAQAAPAGFWETRLHPFLERHSRVLALFLVAIASIRIVATYAPLSLTFDEPGHFACGLEYLSKHVYRYESQHPPLARAATALGPYLAGARLIGGPQRDYEGVNVIKATGRVDRTVFLMRIGILPFFWLACVVVYSWSRRVASAGIAVLALAFFTLTPPVLAHAGLATTDMAVTACLLAAFHALLMWAESPSWRTGALLGLTSALAALSKFTALGYLPAAAVLALVFWVAAAGPAARKVLELARGRWPTFAFAVLTGALAVWAAYWFSFGEVPGWHVSLPAPEFFDGARIAASHSEGGHGAYLLGETSLKGWWYFFPVALAVKTPLALLLLAVPGAWVIWKNRSRPGHLTVAAFSLGILLPAMASHVNIGVRHVLPIYGGLSILAALGFARVASWAVTPKAALAFAAVPLLWAAISGALSHPDYLAYFNELSGKEPEKILVDSDLDWGQETKRLARRLRELGASHVALKLNEQMIHEALYNLGSVSALDASAPSAGWNVLSPTAWKHADTGPILTGTDAGSLMEALNRPKPWYERVSPTERVGALLLYYVPAGSPLLKP